MNKDIEDKDIEAKDIEAKDIEALYKDIDSRFTEFSENNKYCLALTEKGTQCCKLKDKNSLSRLLCTYHRNKKFLPENIIVYIDYGNLPYDLRNHPKHHTIDTHIITYPYVNKEKYFADIEIYKQELKDIEHEKYLKLHQINTCKVCDGIFHNRELVKCSKITSDNCHAVCSTCIKGYIESQISDNIGTYECMFNKFEKCCGEYSITSMSIIFDNFYNPDPSSESTLASDPTLASDSRPVNYITKNNDIKTKWLELVNITDIYKLANICDNYFTCPLCCKWGCIFEINPMSKGNVYIECHNCKLKWCNLCKREGHGEDAGEYGCYTLDFKDEETIEQRIKIIDFLIQDMISKALTHKCSTCGFAYIKEEGCNLMHCSHCNGMSCYLCNAKIYYKEDKGKYWHFAGHDLSDPDTTCLIWNNDAGDGQENQGNTNYNNTKILKELILFLINNNRNVLKIIYDRIMFLYETDEQFTFIISVLKDLNADNFNNIPNNLLTY